MVHIIWFTSMNMQYYFAVLSSKRDFREHFFRVGVQLTRSSLSFEIFYEYYYYFNHHLRKSKNPQGKLFLTEWVCMSNVVAWNSLLKPHENLGIFWRIIASATGMNFELFLPFCGRTYVATTKSSALKGLEVHSDHYIDESVSVKMCKNELTTFLKIEDSKLVH